MITIAIPTYERGTILVQTIRYLLELEPPADEILIVDQTRSHSQDVELQLEKWLSEKKIVSLRLPQPSIPHAMNEALRRASNALVLFVDDDIIPSKDLIAAHEEAHSCGAWVVVGQVLQPGESSEHFSEQILHSGPLRDLGFRFNHDTPCDVENIMAGNLSVDRKKALEIGGFDENFVAAAYRFETDFARRVIAAGGRICFAPRASIRHLHVPSGGVRAHGDERRSATPSHSVGDYYFALLHIRSFWTYALRRLRSNVLTRWMLAHPWYMFPKIVAELRGYALARRLLRAGRRLAE